MAKYYVRADYLKHRQGTKDYRVLLLVNHETKNALFIKRWGKVGTKGQKLVEHGTEKAMRKAFTEKSDEKIGGGYIMAAGQQIYMPEANWAEAEDALRRFGVFEGIPSAVITFVCGETSAIPDGTTEELWPTAADEPVKPKVKAPKAPSEDYADDPTWGMF